MPPQRIFGAPQPLLADFGVGKWSRIATFGKKAQRQADGKMMEWEFTPQLFAEAVRNYAHMFSQRRLGSDWEHQARGALLNGRAAPNLCYWDGMAVIEGDALGAMHEQQPGPAPNPAELRAMLAARFPRADPDPGGLWVRCSEVTDLGRQVIPCYEQLSPLFSEAQLDESGKPIGFAVSNVSFVNVAHQDGTFFNFSALGLTDAVLHPSGPERKTMNEQEMMKKLGMAEGCTDKAAMKTAFEGYMETTPDGPEERKAMRAAFMAKMGAMPDMMPDKDKDGMAAMPDADKKTEAAAMAAQRQALSALSAQHQATQAELAQMKAREQAREAQAKQQRLAAFASSACTPVSGGGTGQWDPSKRADLEGLCKDLSEDRWPTLLAGVPKGAFGGGADSARLFRGGNPAGGARPSGFAPAYALQQKTIGFSATQQAFALLEKEGVKNPDMNQLARALRQVGGDNPDILREAQAPSPF